MNNTSKTVLEILQEKDGEQKLRHINFIPAKFSTKIQMGNQIIFTEKTENYSICYGGSKNPKQAYIPTLYDSQVLATIRKWAKQYNLGRGIDDKLERSFAIAVLFCLRSCPSFRQYCSIHVRECSRVNCTLCKIAHFFEGTEESKNLSFPFDIAAIDPSWHPGSPGNSAKFFDDLISFLQSEEILSHRSFGSISQYTSAIGQIFHIEVRYSQICSQCEKINSETETQDLWSLPISSIKEIMREYKLPINYLDSSKLPETCECGGDIKLIRTFPNLPLIITLQWPNKKAFDFEKNKTLKFGDKSYKLIGFTTEKDGHKFESIFLNSTGTWSGLFGSQIRPVMIASFHNYIPQLLFYSTNENNTQLEKITIEPISKQDFGDIEEEKRPEEEESLQVEKEELDAMCKTAIENIKAKIASHYVERTAEEEFSKGKPRRANGKDVVVVDSTDDVKRPRKAEHSTLKTASKNPMEILMAKKQRIHETAKWDGVETTPDRDALTVGWQEPIPDDYDKALDAGHKRKIKKKELPMAQESFKDTPKKRRPDEFGGKNDSHGRGGHGFRGRGGHGFHGRGNFGVHSRGGH